MWANVKQNNSDTINRWDVTFLAQLESSYMFPSLHAAIIWCKIVTISHPIVFQNGGLKGDEQGGRVVKETGREQRWVETNDCLNDRLANALEQGTV